MTLEQIVMCAIKEAAIAQEISDQDNCDATIKAIRQWIKERLTGKDLWGKTEQYQEGYTQALKDVRQSLGDDI